LIIQKYTFANAVSVKF